MTEQKKKRKPGVYWNESYIDIVRKLAENTENGCTDEEIASAIGCTIKSIIRWRAKYPEFAKECYESKKRKDDQVVSALFNRAIGHEYEEKKVIQMPDGSERIEITKKEVLPDTTACIFWLKNRTDEWRDVNKVEHSGGTELRLIVTDMSTRNIKEITVPEIAVMECKEKEN